MQVFKLWNDNNIYRLSQYSLDYISDSYKTVHNKQIGREIQPKCLKIQIKTLSTFLQPNQYMSLESDTVEKELSQNDQIPPTPKKTTTHEDTSNYLSRIYWTFIDKKKLKFSHQFPRMRENEITNKIIREWQALTMEQKLKLGEKYDLKQEQDSNDNQSDFRLDSRSEEHKISDHEPNTKVKFIKEEKIILERDSTGAKPTDMIKLNIQDSESQVKHQEIKDQEDDEASSVSSSGKQTSKSRVKKQIGQKPKKTIKKKNKPIKKPEDLIKLRNGDYLLFYKHYYLRLKSQHPKWSSIQINHIIKLLWKKKQQQNKKIKQQSKKNQNVASKDPSKKIEPKRPISGKEYFTREKKKELLSKEQIDFLWKQLPRESKNDWNKRGARLGFSVGKKESALITNKTSESSQNTEGNSAKKKMVISFKDALLKGGLREEQAQPDAFNSILQEKDETPKKQSIKKQMRVQGPEIKQKKQNCEYVSLGANPFSFMKNKINLEKIILE